MIENHLMSFVSAHPKLSVWFSRENVYPIEGFEGIDRTAFMYRLADRQMSECLSASDTNRAVRDTFDIIIRANNDYGLLKQIEQALLDHATVGGVHGHRGSFGEATVDAVLVSQSEDQGWVNQSGLEMNEWFVELRLGLRYQTNNVPEAA